MIVGNREAHNKPGTIGPSKPGNQSKRLNSCYNSRLILYHSYLLFTTSKLFWLRQSQGRENICLIFKIESTEWMETATSNSIDISFLRIRTCPPWVNSNIQNCSSTPDELGFARSKFGLMVVAWAQRIQTHILFPKSRFHSWACSGKIKRRVWS